MTLLYLPELNPFFCILLASHQGVDVKRKEHHLDVKKEVHSIQIVRLEFPIFPYLFGVNFSIQCRPGGLPLFRPSRKKVKNRNSIIKHFCKLPILLPNQPY